MKAGQDSQVPKVRDEKFDIDGDQYQGWRSLSKLT